MFARYHFPSKEKHSLWNSCIYSINQSWKHYCLPTESMEEFLAMMETKSNLHWVISVLVLQGTDKNNKKCKLTIQMSLQKFPWQGTLRNSAIRTSNQPGGQQMFSSGWHIYTESWSWKGKFELISSCHWCHSSCIGNDSFTKSLQGSESFCTAKHPEVLESTLPPRKGVGVVLKSEIK